MFVRADAGDSRVWLTPAFSAVVRLSKVHIGHVPRASDVIARVIKADIHAAVGLIDGEPRVKTVYGEPEGIGNTLAGRPSGSVVRVRSEDVGAGRCEVHP